MKREPPRRRFVEMRIRARASLAVAIESALLDAGAQGTSQEWPGGEGARAEGPQADSESATAGAERAQADTESATVEIVGYFSPASVPEDAHLRELIARYARGGGSSAGEALGGVSIARREQPWEDWVAKTRRALGPVRATARLWIAPPWEMPRARDAREDLLIIEPGQAFGTGMHATTRGCLALIERWMGEARPAGERRLALDVGTGTGILALRALQCGADVAYGNDVEAQAVRAARENAGRNALAARAHFYAGTARAVRLAPTAAAARPRFDLVLANLFLNPLLELAGFFAAAVHPGGALIVSGFHTGDRAEIERAYRAHGFRLRAEQVDDDWVARYFHQAP